MPSIFAGPRDRGPHPLAGRRHRPRRPGSEPLTLVANFPGIPQTPFDPPDGALAVGPAHLIEAVNTSLRISDRAGTPLFESTLEDWFVLPPGLLVGDPRAAFDPFASRWVVLGTTFDFDPAASYLALSVSDTPDPLGPWHLFFLDFQPDGGAPTSNYLDYPTFGLDSEAFYIGGNMFNRFSPLFSGAKVRAYRKEQFYNPTGSLVFAEWVRLDGGRAFTPQPCATFEQPGREWVVVADFGSSNRLNLFAVTGMGAGETPVLTGPSRVKVARYSIPPDAEQKDSPVELDSGDVRILSAVFSQGSVWCTHGTSVQWRGDPRRRSAIRWYQLEPDPRASTPALAGPRFTVRQQATIGEPRGEYYFPALMTDSDGNVAIAYQFSGPAIFPAFGMMGRLHGDPAGRITRNSVIAKGPTPYNVPADSRGEARWGDYCGIARDPLLPATIWGEGEISASTQDWATHVAAVRF